MPGPSGTRASEVPAGLIVVARSYGALRGLFPGWWIVSGSMVMQALLGTLFFYGYSAFVPFWMAEFGWSRTTISLAFSLHRTESALLGPLHGWLLQRYAPRHLFLIGAIVLGGGFLVLSQVQNLIQFMATFLVMAVGASFCGGLTVMTVIVNWFERRRSTALSLMHLGFSLGGLAVPLLALGLVAYGWRTMALVSGLMVLAIGIPLARLLVRDPETLGLGPDGAGAAAPGDGAASPRPVRRALTVRESLATGAFWLSSFGQAAAVAVGAGLMVHFVVYAHEELGLAVTVAAALVALMTGTTILGQLVGGVAGDRWDKRYLAGGSLLGLSLALVLLAQATTVTAAAVAAIVLGLSAGVRAPLMGAIKAELFGRKNFAAVTGFASLITMIGAIGGPIVVGVLADVTGAYTTAFWCLATIAFAGSFAFFGLRNPHADVMP